MKIINFLDSLIDRITNIFAYIAGFFLVYIVVVVTVEVITRYFFNKPLPFTFDISQILLYLITYFSAAWVMKRKGHVSMDFLLVVLKKKHQLLLNGITSMLSAVVSLVVCWYGVVVTIDLLQRNINEGLILVLPRAPIISVIPICFFLLFFQCLKQSLGHLSEWKNFSEQEQ